MKPTRLNRFQTFAVCSVLTTLTACTPTDKVPLSGRITMEYAGVSLSGDDVMFTLENGTAQAIYFRGTPDPALGKLKMICDSGNEAVAYGQGVFEPALKDKIIDVKPGERMHLHLLATLAPDLKNHKDRCQLSLTLESGAVVESREFVP